MIIFPIDVNEDGAGYEAGAAAAAPEARRGKKEAQMQMDFAELFGPYFETADQRRASTVAEELRDYAQVPQIPTMENPLAWWSRNEQRFPRLSKLAKSYLAVPATSTPSERVFSLAGNTVTRQRSSLHPDHVDKLVFVNANQKGKKKVINEDDFDSQSEDSEEE